MRVHRRFGCAPFRASQRGQAVLFVVLLLAVGIGLFAYGAVSSVSLSQQQDVKTRLALTMARDALIGWSVARTSPIDGANARPGELPCPDINPLDGYEDGSCAAGAIGRVPWKTLGIPEPKDDAGETLWYAIGGPFRIWNVNGNPINSDTKGNITVYQESTATVLTTEAVAIIFAAGAPLGTQSRSTSATALCPTTSTTIAQNLCAANYLETTATVNNATTNGPYISAQRSDTFNDRLLVVTTADLMPVVEQRVAREILALLRAYRTAPANTCACYTWGDNDFNGEGDNDTFRGWPSLLVGDPHTWGFLGITVPAWLTNNNWWQVIYYAVAPDETQNKSGGTLTVDGVPGFHVVLITPGPAIAGDGRPNAPPPVPPWDWTKYLDDPENADHSNNIYFRPSSTAYARDRLYTYP